MNKDIIYIDVEDDITSVIGKVKASREKIVAIVPPKRVGVLQSAVNLRLLQRAATSSKKRLVLITSNHALVALAAATKMPVARNLQSKPELPEIAALDIDDGDDVIDGINLPVGELARTSDKKLETSSDTVSDEVIESIAEPPKEGEKPIPPKRLRGVKVPNFNSFRKKLFLAIGGAIALLIFFIWAIVYAPRATVVITARTTSTSVAQTVNLSPDVATNFTTAVIKSTRQEQKKEASVTFDATGQKNIGEKATATVSLSKLSATSTSIPAGTQLTSSGGLVFITNEEATIPASVPCFPSFCAQSKSVGVTAAEAGAKYNGATGNLSGAPSGASASFSGASAGGTDKVATVVTAEDVQKASETLAAQEDKTMKATLTKALGSGVVVIDSSYTLTKGGPVSAPEVGKEATGKAKLTTQITYSIIGIAKSELNIFLNAALKKEIDGKEDQRIYDNGASKVTFSGFSVESENTKVRLSATAQLGPQIKDDEIKQQVKGKRAGEVQEELGKIEGIEDVQTNLWPFWVQNVPTDDKRITIEFKLNDKK